MVVLAAIPLLQPAVLVLIGPAPQGSPRAAVLLGSPRFELFVGIAISGLAAMGLGLMISALVRNGDKAVTLLPLILVPQLVLTSPQLSIYNKPGLAQVADVASAQWGYAIFASTIDANQLVDDAQVGPGPSQFDKRGRWNHDTRAWLTDAGWLIGLVTVELAVTAVLLRRRDPSSLLN